MRKRSPGLVLGVLAALAVITFLRSSKSGNGDVAICNQTGQWQLSRQIGGNPDRHEVLGYWLTITDRDCHFDLKSIPVILFNAGKDSVNVGNAGAWAKVEAGQDIIVNNPGLFVNMPKGQATLYAIFSDNHEEALATLCQIEPEYTGCKEQ